MLQPHKLAAKNSSERHCSLERQSPSKTWQPYLKRTKYRKEGQRKDKNICFPSFLSMPISSYEKGHCWDGALLALLPYSTTASLRLLLMNNVLYFGKFIIAAAFLFVNSKLYKKVKRRRKNKTIMKKERESLLRKP